MGVVVSFPDRRKSPRKDVGNHLAQIDFRNGRTKVQVCLWDISPEGACLLVPAGTRIPEAFDLIVDGWSHPVKVFGTKNCLWAFVFAGVLSRRSSLKPGPQQSACGRANPSRAECVGLAGPDFTAGGRFSVAVATSTL